MSWRGVYIQHETQNFITFLGFMFIAQGPTICHRLMMLVTYCAFAKFEDVLVAAEGYKSMRLLEYKHSTFSFHSTKRQHSPVVYHQLLHFSEHDPPDVRHTSH